VTAGRWQFALDQNFPQPIIDALGRFMPDVQLTPIRAIDERLPDLGDRELIIALHQLGWAALVTNNYRMLSNPQELAAVLKTKVAVIAIKGLGHDMVRASGALLLDLPGVCKRFAPGTGQVFVLHPRDPRPRDPWEGFKKVAEHAQREVDELYDEVKVTDAELNRPVLA
jgi:hypothetical protein